MKQCYQKRRQTYSPVYIKCHQRKCAEQISELLLRQTKEKRFKDHTIIYLLKRVKREMGQEKGEIPLINSLGHVKYFFEKSVKSDLLHQAFCRDNLT